MYSHEIEELLKFRNYLISNLEYLNIVNTSPHFSKLENQISVRNDGNANAVALEMGANTTLITKIIIIYEYTKTTD